MSDYVLVRRELLEDIISTLDYEGATSWTEALRTAIAAPVVERQPIAHRIEFTDGHKSKWIDGAPASIDIDDAREGVIAGIELAYTSPPAPVSVVLPEPKASLESFILSQTDDDACFEGPYDSAHNNAALFYWTGAINKIKELNQ